MISFPHAKINLGLSIISKRPDGFHNLETIFYPLPLYDVLEIVDSEVTRFLPAGLSIPGKSDDNLVMRAYRHMKKKYPKTGALDIHLYKAIPMGAGMGGGSADAAGIILMINRFFDLNISTAELHSIALELGSDCPFFTQSDPCFASGRGEILEPVSLDLTGYSFLLVHPEIHIDTAWAFSRIRPGKPIGDLKKSILQPVREWKNILFNDFEKPVFGSHPSLQKIKQDLYSAGALYASLTGSGSTIFGIFNKPELPDSFKVANAGLTVIR
jgi:4-diphosphocytidyl-2-C-methyl-D-erythritol kinase